MIIKDAAKNLVLIDFSKGAVKILARDVALDAAGGVVSVSLRIANVEAQVDAGFVLKGSKQNKAAILPAVGDVHPLP